MTLRVASDEPLEPYLRAYDLSEEVEPGEPARPPFEVALTGRSGIEAERMREEPGVLAVPPC